jgi:serine/threonine-protein kinase SRPK3
MGSPSRRLVPYWRDTTSHNLSESEHDYKLGGFHPVRPGDVYDHGRYKVVRKLGFGAYSTVWLTEDTR